MAAEAEMPLNSQFRTDWKAAGYSKWSGSAAVVAAPARDVKRLYYLTSADYAISNIERSRLKIARISQLNDPFELLGANLKSKQYRNIVSDHKIEFDRSKGLICMSEDWIDPVLWSHYADKHRGIALGFDIDRSIAKKVEYKYTRLKEQPNTEVTNIDSRLEEILLCAKFNSWKYEREWRIIFDLNITQPEESLHFTPFNDKIKLVEVILGCTCKKKLERLRGLVKEHHENVTTFCARLAHQSFKIIASEKTVPGL